MPKVGIYCRLSIEDKDKLKTDDSQSIQNQKSMLRDYCNERNWEIYDIYCDDGFSGTDRTRPAFNRLISDCKSGKIDIVLCKDQSRFSRDTIIIEQYINDKFLEWGIRFIGVADNADSDSEMYGTMRLFTSAYNEMYVKDISAKIRRTLSYKREHGEFIGSFAPYGYKIDPDDKHHLIVDEEAASVVKEIFEMYVQGNGYRKIVFELNSRGILSPSAYKHNTGSNYVNCNADESNSKGLWTQSTIARILHNEMYTGTLVQGKSHHISYKNKKRKRVAENEWIKVPNAHEAIIDIDIWKQAQERLNSHTRVGKNSWEISPLSGKVQCAICGRPMKRNVYYNKAKTIQYYGLQCATYKTGAMNCSNIKSISGKILEKKVIDELNKIIEQYCQTDEINLTDFHSEQIEKLKKQLEKLQTQQKTSESRLTQMYKDKLDGIISDSEYSIFRETLISEKQDILNRIENIKNQLDELSAKKINADNQRTIIKEHTHFTNIDRTIADEFIDYIEVGEVSNTGERDIFIHWKI